MKGRSAIVLRVQQHNFHEHADVEGAVTEAKRLAEKVGGEFVVYVPVLSVAKPPEYIVRDVRIRGPYMPIEPTVPRNSSTEIGDDDDLPF